jgi:hypothetical protein
MAAANKRSADRTGSLVLSKDVRISEKLGISRARNAKTGRLLSEGDQRASAAKPPHRTAK